MTAGSVTTSPTPLAPLAVVEAGTVAYGTALAWQNDLHGRRVAGSAGDVVLLLEHPHVYTLGRRFSAEHLLADPETLARRGIEVFEADRGGSITYHGPGQLVGYPIVALADPAASPEVGSMKMPDAIAYLRNLEEAVIRTAAAFGVAAGRREGLTGVWVGEEKLASIGVNMSRGVTKHGFALNVDADLSYFAGMVPCGIPSVAVTSLERLLGTAPAMAEVQAAAAFHLATVLGREPVPATLADVGLDASEGGRSASGEAAGDAGLGLLPVTMPDEATVLAFRRRAPIGDPVGGQPQPARAVGLAGRPDRREVGRRGDGQG
jgi:lipoate-protein ligase B